MNILFVLYQDFTSNSAGHVRSLANELVKMGHDCCVAVPENKQSVDGLGNVLFHPVSFPEALQSGFGFRNGRAPDLIHAWTPRERVRKFCEQVRKMCSCRLFIHMEDNEWHLLTCCMGRPYDTLKLLEREELDRLVPDSLSHPVRAMEFLSGADGVTVIIDRLRDILPPVRAILELWPSADEDLFKSYPRPSFEKARLGIAQNSTVVTYTGNVHPANCHEVRSLYLAIAILNREGFPSTLVRTGRDFVSFLGPDETWARAHAVELGLVPREQLPTLLAMADVLVQPGRSDKFNDYRFPSKLPEFFSAGRPVILPQANIARYMVHGQHGFILPDSNAVSIASAIREIMADVGLYQRLTAGALDFFRKRLSWASGAEKLVNFYIRTQKSGYQTQVCSAVAGL